MQSSVLCAFRKRCRKRGYRNISIKQARDEDGKVKPDRYAVFADEPLSGQRVSVEHYVGVFDKLMR